jgi:hypothetical protein
VVATEAGVDAIDVLETVGEPRGRQIIRSKPPAEIGERSSDRRKGDADQCESCQRAGLAKAQPLGFCWCFRVVQHLSLQSNRTAWRRTYRVQRYFQWGNLW